ncbi:MAG TPA: hypothetical protein VG426_13060 [Candidatus Dormibacteraeota bacterium]|nr:hypothetical protein [Candidatus Dormibacteraeota bacterium]
MSRFLGAFGPVFVAIGFLCAPIAALMTSIAYENQKSIELSIGAGLVVGVASGGIVGLVYWRFYRTAEEAYPDQFRELGQRLATTVGLISSSPGRTDPCAVAAKNEADELSASVDHLLNHTESGSLWVSATGYLLAWSGIYRLEEAAIQLVPSEHVLAMARDDLSRLSGSSIPDTTHLKERLDNAIKQLITATAPGSRPGSASDEVSARCDIAAVRKNINRYREEMWKGLVSERNRIMLTTAIAGLFALLALDSVVFWHVDPKALQVAGAFIITGAVVSLLHQATLVGNSDAGVEDFGQSTARLLAATFVSGLIALLGVIVVEGSGLSVNGGGPIIPTFDHWRQVFDWTQNKSGFFWAALFGFAPSVLFQILQRNADDIKGSLVSSQATGATGKS